jgi:hypothetical protein
MIFSIFLHRKLTEKEARVNTPLITPISKGDYTDFQKRLDRFSVVVKNLEPCNLSLIGVIRDFWKSPEISTLRFSGLKA